MSRIKEEIFLRDSNDVNVPDVGVHGHNRNNNIDHAIQALVMLTVVMMVVMVVVKEICIQADYIQN